MSYGIQNNWEGSPSRAESCFICCWKVLNSRLLIPIDGWLLVISDYTFRYVRWDILIYIYIVRYCHTGSQCLGYLLKVCSTQSVLLLKIQSARMLLMLMILYATIVVWVLYDIKLIESIIKKQIEVVLRISLIWPRFIYRCKNIFWPLHNLVVCAKNCWLKTDTAWQTINLPPLMISLFSLLATNCARAKTYFHTIFLLIFVFLY
jgi:hypothetical protein